MFTVTAIYEDGTKLVYESIVKAVFASDSERQDSEEDLLGCNVELAKDLYFKSENGNYTVSNNGLRAVEITKDA